MKKILITVILVVLIHTLVHAQSVKRSYKSLAETTYNVADLILAPQIWFEASGCYIIPESKDSAKVIADFISKHPGIVIEIGVHTEVKDPPEEYIKVSKCQAKAVVRYLVKELRVPKSAVEAKGYGGSEPVISEELIRTSPMYRDYLNQKNRRVELKILFVK